MQQIIIANIISGKLIAKHYRKEEEEYFIACTLYNSIFLD